MQRLSFQKRHSFRQKGLDVLFKRDGDLANFQHHVWTSAVPCSVDSVTYAPDPMNATQMSCVIHEQTRFSIESIGSVMKEQVLNFDNDEKTNDTEIAQLLLNLLDPDLAKCSETFAITTTPT